MNEQKALKYIKHVLIVGIIVGILFGLNIISAFMRDVEFKVIYAMMTRMIMAISILLGMTWGVYIKRSRICSVLLFSISMFFFILELTENIKISTLISLIFIVIYFNGIRATIYYHNKLKIKG
ncbi:hypothetical protein [Clostridium uliginosum]|uniref:Uncharacterized protein n=1 Tax=Clostridium uliginosum TaxID=119641 RepID=A0A1I1R1V4_9CLOT|nr:hypothetical protein [Clostridium uliginosum]SFD28232.1 hypothetical protein SAMN05421842_12934 [Clostridium uliginosum]